MLLSPRTAPPIVRTSVNYCSHKICVPDYFLFFPKCLRGGGLIKMFSLSLLNNNIQQSSKYFNPNETGNVLSMYASSAGQPRPYLNGPYVLGLERINSGGGAAAERQRSLPSRRALLQTKWLPAAAQCQRWRARLCLSAICAFR